MAGARRTSRARPRSARPAPRRPTRQELLAATGRRVPDLVGPRLDVLFCGINPGLYSAATGHHFARPGNRFWAALRAGGFTPRLVAPWEERELLALGLGITNLVARTTASAAELQAHELREGRRRLERKLLRWSPRWVAVLGLGAYRQAFERPHAQPGRQPERIGRTRIWLLPSPSGLNAHHQPGDLARRFRQLRRALLADGA